MKTPSAELIELCGEVRDAIATPEQIARLETLLANDREARRFYRRFIQISAGLERYEQCHAGTAATAPATPADRPRRRIGRATQWLALAAGFAVLASLYFNVR